LDINFNSKIITINPLLSQIDLNKLDFDNSIIGQTAGPLTLGDIDGDGHRDIVVLVWASSRGDSSDGVLYWYRYPSWNREVVKDSAHFFGDGIMVFDFDGDSDKDIITCQGNDSISAVCWYENDLGGSSSSWLEHIIDTLEFGSEVKNIDIGDIDKNGHKDIVVRTKRRVGIYFREASGILVKKELVIRDREGMVLGDIDGDSDLDVILNGFFMKNPADARLDDWTEHKIDDQWYTDDTGGWQDHSVMVDVGDFNKDGNLDVVYSHSEKAGFMVSWYERIDSKGLTKGWKRHDVGVIDYCHTLKTGDLDLDGDDDLLVGSSIRDSLPQLSVYLNMDDGSSWLDFEVDDKAVYKGIIGDIDEDGDLDIVSPVSWVDPPIHLWRNLLNPSLLPLDNWDRHLIDGELMSNALFIESGDLDGDGLIDLVAGGRWWKNPGTLDKKWNRREIGSPLNNAALVFDVDGDSDLDIFGSQGKGAAANNEFAWAENDGSGHFTVITNIATGGTGDFLQGRVLSNFGDGAQIALSWHNGGGAIHVLNIPPDPSELEWDFGVLSTVTQKEDLSAGDIDRDGDVDLLLGTIWLRNDGGTWTDFVLGELTDLDPDAEPDRNELADINGDNRLDAVVGLENGEHILWFEAPGNPEGMWERHVIGLLEGEGFSLDVADFDEDGDMDVVVGEHRGSINNRVILYENRDGGEWWQVHEIDSDSKEVIDHHDGTQVADMDADGDLDIISTGWYIKKVWIFKNGSFINKIEKIEKSVSIRNYELGQNYPNPFNPITTINFYLPHSGEIKLTIYNLVGESIMVPWKGFKPAGYHHIDINADSLPTGVYFYRLQAEKFDKIKKMILLK
jgi:hypothetical protein